MTTTHEYRARVKLIREALQTFLEQQRNFNAALWPPLSPNWLTADTRLDGLLETISMLTQLQLDLERELARDIS